MSESGSLAKAARQILRRFHIGVLGTRSVRHADYPYTAALPYCTDHQGRPVVLISHLSEHTRAIARDPRVSFTVAPMVPTLRPQARATILGQIALCDDAAMAARYLRFFPDNREFLDIGGFRFFSISLEHVRLIAGFGSAHWLDGKSVLAQEAPIAQAEQDILEHMNRDHHDSLVLICRHVHDIQTETAAMVGIDCDGFDVRAEDMIYHFEFNSPVADPADARAALVALARAARS